MIIIHFFKSTPKKSPTWYIKPSFLAHAQLGLRTSSEPIHKAKQCEWCLSRLGFQFEAPPWILMRICVVFATHSCKTISCCSNGKRPHQSCRYNLQKTFENLTKPFKLCNTPHLHWRYLTGNLQPSPWTKIWKPNKTTLAGGAPVNSTLCVYCFVL